MDYPGTDIKKFPVPSEFVDWEKVFPEYDPVNYTAETVLRKPSWADPEIRYEYHITYYKAPTLWQMESTLRPPFPIT